MVILINVATIIDYNDGNHDEDYDHLIIRQYLFWWSKNISEHSNIMNPVLIVWLSAANDSDTLASTARPPATRPPHVKTMNEILV